MVCSEKFWKERLRGRLPLPLPQPPPRLALVSICEIDVTSFSEDGRGVKWLTNRNPTLTLTPNHNPNRNPNSNPNQINEKIQKETTLEIDQITYKCQFGRWKLVKTL